MKKLMIVIVFVSACAFVIFAQPRPTLGVLPLSGGNETEGEVIASLFLTRRELRDVFDVVPRNMALEAIFIEREFMMSQLVAPEAIAGIRRILDADYILSSRITRMGGRNLLIAKVIRVDTFALVAGYSIEFHNIEEILDLLPGMSRGLAENAAAALGRTAMLPSLAVAPFSHPNWVSAEYVETLAELFAIEAIKSGQYTILPRLSVMQSALREQGFRMLGSPDDIGTASLGRAMGATYVLGGSITRLGDIDLFLAQILSVEDGRVIEGGTVKFQAIVEGLDLMSELALLLTHPDPADAFLNLGLTHVNAREYDLAIEHFTRSIQLNPNLWRAYFHRARIHIHRGELDRAIADNTQAIRLNPNHWPAHHDRGLAHFRRGEYDLAISDFTEAIRLASDARSYTNRGHAHLRRGEYDLAVSDFTAAILLAPDARSYTYRGLAHSNMRNFYLAVSDFETALRLEPDLSHINGLLQAARSQQQQSTINEHVTSGDAYLSRGRLNRAVAEFETVLQLKPNHDHAMRQRQLAMEQLEIAARARFHSVGFSLGTSLAEPWVISTVQATVAPLRHSFLRIGCDLGFAGDGTGSFSVYPFAHFATFVPIGRRNGWHLGIGGGLMIHEYRFNGSSADGITPMLEIATGFIIGNRVEISYTFRTDVFTDLSSHAHKLSFGIVHRFFRR